MVEHKRFIVFCLLFVVLVQAYSATIPPFEGSDEIEHFAYVNKLREKHQLPNPDTDLKTTSIRQEVLQSPLYYIVAASVMSLRDWGNLDFNEIEGQRNPWDGYPAPTSSNDNRRHFLTDTNNHVMTSTEKNMVNALQWTRLGTLLFGGLAMLGMYWAGLRLFESKSLALFACIIFGLTPTILSTFSMVTNDSAIIAFALLTLAISLELYKTPQRQSLYLLTGLFLGLAVLSKASGIALIALPLLAIFLAWQQHRLTRQQWLTYSFSIVGLAMLMGGWWFLRNWVLYDDPLGIKPHLAQPWAYDSPQPIGKVLRRIEIVIRTLWDNMAAGEIRPGFWARILPASLILMGILGWLKSRPKAKLLLPLLMVTVGFVSLVRWMQLFDLITGRLFLPFYGGLILLVVWGVKEYRRFVPFLSGLAGATAFLLIPLTLMHAFNPPPLHDKLPEDVTPVYLDFGGPRLVGYDVDSTIIHQGDQREFTLCWQAPAGDKKLEVPYPFALHIVDARDNRIVGRRESYPGLGNYTLWQPNKIFCDKFYLPIDESLEAGVAYPISVTLFDLETTNALPAIDEVGNSISNTQIGLLVSPAPAITDEALSNGEAFFGDAIVLVDYVINQTDSTLAIDVDWGTKTEPPHNLKQFVHVINEAGDIVAQYDGIPGGSLYPVSIWGKHQHISDHFEISIEALPSGRYQVITGIYDPTSFARLAVVDSAGTHPANDAFPLYEFSIP